MIYSFKDCVSYNKNTFNTVLHIGANKGQEIEEYSQFAVKKIIWVEALEELMSDLKKNTKNYQIEQEYYCDLLSDKDNEKIIFNVANNEGQSSSMLDFGTHKKYVPSVEMINKKTLISKKFSTFSKENKINLNEIEFINLDVQGAELKVLTGFENIFQDFQNIKGVFSEVNFEEVYVGCPLIQDIDGFFDKFNFKRVLTHRFSNPWGDAFYIRN